MSVSISKYHTDHLEENKYESITQYKDVESLVLNDIMATIDHVEMKTGIELRCNVEKYAKIYKDCKNGDISVSIEDGKLVWHPGGIGFGLFIVAKEFTKFSVAYNDWVKRLKK
jgi:hypothetical protein